VLAENRIRDAVDDNDAGKRAAAREAPLASTGPDGTVRVDPSANTQGPADKAARGEQVERLEGAISALPEDPREIVLLRDDAGMAWEDSATRVGRPSPDAARMARGKALLLLAARMRERFAASRHAHRACRARLGRVEGRVHAEPEDERPALGEARAEQVEVAVDAPVRHRAVRPRRLEAGLRRLRQELREWVGHCASGQAPSRALALMPPRPRRIAWPSTRAGPRPPTPARRPRRTSRRWWAARTTRTSPSGQREPAPRRAWSTGRARRHRHAAGRVRRGAGGRARGTTFTGAGILFTPTTDTITFNASASHPRVTLVSMVAPSPDWFVGVAGLDLLAGGQWVEQAVIPLLAWDAGTDSGTTFTAADIDTVPQAPMAPITSGPIGTGVPLGTFTFTRLDAPPPWSDLGGALAGRGGAPMLAIDGAPVAGSPLVMTLTGAAPSAPVFLVGGVTVANLPLKGGVLVPGPLGSGPAGSLLLASAFPAGFPSGTLLVLQAWVADAGGPAGFAASNALCATSS